MNGIMNNRSVEDETMILEIGKTANKKNSMVNNSKVMIYDARPYINAQANKIKHGGFENKKYYKNADIEFCDIDNIHEVTKCFKKMQEIPMTYSNINLI
jgi:hypothetical protein